MRLAGGGALKATSDAVLLAASVAPPAAARDARVLDAGCGAGTVALCLAARRADWRLAGLERDEATAELARANVAANGWRERIAIHRGDLARWRPQGPLFDAVATNPPWLDPAQGSAPPDPQRAAARVETMPLARWIENCLRLLRPGGALHLLHRPERLAVILAALEGRAGAIALRPLHAAADAPAGRILLRAVKGSKAAPDLLPGLVLHDEGGAWTPAARAVLRDGAALAGGGVRECRWPARAGSACPGRRREDR